MKRILLLVAVLVSASFAYAQDTGKTVSLTGTVCDSKCAFQITSSPIPKYGCRKDCGESGGEAMFIDDQGKMMKIDNPDMVKTHMGKHVKMKAQMMPQGDMMHVMHISDKPLSTAQQAGQQVPQDDNTKNKDTQPKQ